MRVHVEMWVLGGVLVLVLIFGGWAIARHANNEGPASGNLPVKDIRQSPIDSGGDLNKKNSLGLIHECPTAWYQDNMPKGLPPGESDSGPDRYLIIGGKNYLESEVDITWIRQNCEVNQAEQVY